MEGEFCSEQASESLAGPGMMLTLTVQRRADMRTARTNRMGPPSRRNAQ